MEFDTTDIEEPQFFKESIDKLRRVVGEEIAIFSECFPWEEQEEKEEVQKPEVEKILDEMAERRGEL